MAIRYQFDSIITGDLATLQAAYSLALRNAGNVLSAIPANVAKSLSDQALLIAGVVQPLTKSDDPELASNAGDLLNILLIISNLLLGQADVTIKLQVWAPNGYALAAAYYGDATLWENITILDSDGNDTNDPLPAPGLYSVSIPINPVSKPAPGVAFS